MSPPTTAALTRLEEIVGAAHVVSQPADLSGYEVDGLWPAVAVAPGSAEEVAEVVRFAASEKLAVIATGGRSKLRIGAPPRRYELAIGLARLNRVLAYDPGDLTLGVEAGICFHDLDAVLSRERQFLPLAPAFADRATIGGILATNSSTPLRHSYGPARDYVLGMEFVTGEGVQAKSGGRVVKNVTGYDLHKLMIGALGTLGIITRVNFRTFPLPRTQTTFVASFERAEEALELCRAIAKSPLQPRLVEAVGPGAARILVGTGAGAEQVRLPAGQWSVVVTAAGDERVVERHGTDLARMAQAAHAVGFVALSDDEKKLLLGCIREFPKHALESSPAATILRISVLPTQMAALVERAQQAAEQNQVPAAVLVRASGIVYVALVPEAKDDSALRQLAETSTQLLEATSSPEIGGRPMIEWCPTELKRQVNVWGPTRDDVVLMQRLKQAFDPQGILSPGRFAGGI
jgi:glycolate oxidase FAD binding subunit